MAVQDSTKQQRAELLKIIGDPKKVAAEMQQYSNDSRLFDDRWESLLKRYRNEWVAFYRGRVRAHGATLEGLLSEIDRRELPRGRMVIEYLETDPQTLIL